METGGSVSLDRVGAYEQGVGACVMCVMVKVEKGGGGWGTQKSR